MRVQSMSALLLVAFAASSAGCSRTSSGHVTEADANVAAQVDPPVPLIELAESDDGMSVDLDGDHLLKIVLPSHASTGRVWKANAPGPRNVRLVKEVFLSVNPDTIGGPDFQVLYFGADAAGSGTLELDYGIEPPVRHFKVNIRTKGAFTGEVGLSTGPSTTLGGTFSGSDSLSAAPSAPGLPASYDVCAQMAGGCTPIKNQGNCGSCWAFGTVGTLEQSIKLHDGIVRDLSEQYLVSCNFENPKWDCTYGGGYAHNYHWNKFITGEPEAGAVWGPEFPYVEQFWQPGQPEAPCNPPHGHRERISSWAFIDVSNRNLAVDNIKQAIYTYGAVTTVICAGSNFVAYRGGVFSTSDDCGGGVNHMVVLVGWDDSLGVWHLRNSWGTGWGEAGYMRIVWGTSNVGASAAYVVYNPASSGSCPTGQQWCYGRCEDVLSNRFNCGACGVTCPGIANGYPICTNGQCGSACNPGFTMCNGVCTDLMNGKDNCGACGKVCPSLIPGSGPGTVWCNQGCCTVTCNAGYGANYGPY